MQPDFSNCICDGVGMCSKHVGEMLERFPLPVPELDHDLSIHLAWEAYQAARKWFNIDCTHACDEIRGIYRVEQAIQAAWKHHHEHPTKDAEFVATDITEASDSIFESDGNSIS